MYRLVPALMREMGDAYRSCSRARAAHHRDAAARGDALQEDAGDGPRLLAEASGKLKKGDVLPGDVAFKLYDTFGFPLDLTEDALRRAASSSTPMRSMRRCRARRPKRARPGRARARPPPRGSGSSSRRGSARPSSSATRRRLRRARSWPSSRAARRPRSLKAGEAAAIIVNQTPFYGESGGQVGDTGRSSWTAPRCALSVSTSPIRRRSLETSFVHYGDCREGAIQARRDVELRSITRARSATRANHSATHLLHEALRQVLGPHVAQKGSLVAPDRLRFDFSHTKPMTADEIAEVEARANAVCLRTLPS